MRRVGPALGRVPALDGLRGVAIALVVWLHTMAVLVPSSAWHLFGGALGVDIFFVLSGFLITTLLLQGADEGRGRLKRFYQRRAARLLPALAAFLVVHAVAAMVVGWSRRAEAVTIVGAMTFTSNWMPAIGQHVAIASLPLWSLAVEEQFYLLWPATLILLVRLRRPWATVGLAVVGVAVWRAVLTVAYGSGYPVVYQRTDTRLDSLLIGALLALLHQSGWAPSRKLVNIGGAVGALVVAFWVVNPTPTPNALFYGGYTLVALGTAAVILAIVRGGDTIAVRALSWRPLIGLGRISYSLYLWHYLVFVLVAKVVHDTVMRVAAAYLLAVGCAVASYAGIEQPVLRWAASARGSRVAPVAVRTTAPWRLPRPRPRPVFAVVGASCAVLLGFGLVLSTAARQTTTGEVLTSSEAAALSPLSGGRAPVAADGTDPPSGPSVPADHAPASVTSLPSADSGSPVPFATRLTVSAPSRSLGAVGAAVLTLAGSLTNETGEALPGRTIRFALVSQPAVGCAAVTDRLGVASCSVSLATAPTGVVRFTAAFAGDDVASSAGAVWPDEVPARAAAMLSD